MLINVHEKLNYIIENGTKGKSHFISVSGSISYQQTLSFPVDFTPTRAVAFMGKASYCARNWDGISDNTFASIIFEDGAIKLTSTNLNNTVTFYMIACDE